MEPRKPAGGVRLPTPDMLLHTAECLFAENGIATVSNRRVAEVAGAANNSAVNYHYGSKTGLLLAIVRKHNADLEAIRLRMLAEVEGSDNPRDYIACMVLPMTEHLQRLGRPTWYARFSLQAMTDPAFLADFTREVSDTPSNQQSWAKLTALFDRTDLATLGHRSRLVALVVCHACADFERELAQGRTRPGGSWDAVGRFLVDAVTGMLTAPSTRPPA
ncbi:TetR/AcrR family transcriptional regulator [Streptomyces sp. NPDC091212]|uniref:TetR/AcrR family transcriptional regulator n=1 Tax=Streptomyces sp. NPDC091212 TaxID=3155191 RepID=UPI0034192725